jgi:hypothetical protein
VTKVLSVDSSTAVPAPLRRSGFQAAVSSGPSVEEAGAVKWFNVERATWRSAATAYTGCVAFGMDRLAVALFWKHGLNVQKWSAAVRGALTIG